MRTEILCLLLFLSLVFSLLVLLLWACWFFRQWRCLETIIETFQTNEFQTEILQTKSSQTDTMDVKESRESKLASDLQQILNRAAWREQEAGRRKQEVTELLSDLSHQLKTPLANILLDIELLQSAPGQMSETQKQEFLSHAKTQASTMQWLMQCLLKASRLENGMIQFQAENTCIKPTIAKAIGAVYAQASRKNMEICMEEVEDLTLYHNPKWTAEAMANVLENAVKYAPAKSRIVIRMMKMNIYTRITIQDEGPGIPETEYNKVFQRFYRGKNTGTAEGTGLGLYLAQLILQSEQGYITAESKPGQGSRFHFFLLNKWV